MNEGNSSGFQNGYKALVIKIESLRDLINEKFESFRDLVDGKVDALRREIEDVKRDSVRADNELHAEIVELKTYRKEHDKRLTKVERVIWLITGVGVAIGVPIVLYLITQFFEQVVFK